ncbi:MAG: PAS domain-containing protein [Actinomycetota bacterium]
MWPLPDERFEELLRTLPAVFFADSHEAVPRTLRLSPNAEEILGAGAEAHLYDPATWRRSIHPEDRATLVDGWAIAFHHEEPYVVDYRYKRLDGPTVWLREHGTPVRDGGGSITHWQGVLLDVTLEHETFDELLVSERRFREMVENLPAHVYAVSDDEDFVTLYGSPLGAHALGYDTDDEAWAGLTWVDIVHPNDKDRIMDAWRTSYLTGERFDEEYRQVCADGRAIHVHDRAVLIFHDEQRSHWQGVVLDVTGEHETRRELEESETRRRALMDNLPAVVYEMAHDDTRRTISVSPHIERLLGYTREEWLAQPDIWIELLHPDDREIELAAHDEAAQTGTEWTREYRLIAADGRTVWVRDVGRLVHGPSGSTWQGVLLDITARHRAEDALRLANDLLETRVHERTAALEEANALMELEVGERRRAEAEARAAETRFRRLVEDLPAVVYRWDLPDDVMTGAEYVSPGIETVLGYTPFEWRGNALWRERLHPHDREAVLAATAWSEATGEPLEIEYRFLAKDGRVVWVFDRATLIRRHDDGTPATFQGVFVDITARKEAEDQAAESERRFLEILEQGPMITYTYHLAPLDPPTIALEYVSTGISDLLGYPVDQLTSDPASWFEHTHPDDVDDMLAGIRSMWTTGADWEHRFRMIATDGRVVWIHDQARCIGRDASGRPHRFTGVLADVTRAAEAEAAAIAEAAAMREVLHAGPAIAWTEVVDADGRSRFPYISPQVVEIFGYTPAELRGGDDGRYPSVIHPDDRDRVVASSELAQASPGGTWESEYRIIRPDGGERWIHAVSRRETPFGASPAVWHGVTIDVTHHHVADDGGVRVVDAERR